VVRLQQRQPVVVIQAGGTDVAIEVEIAADIFVIPY